MKCLVAAVMLPAAVLASMESPAKKVILFIEELKAEITEDMAKEKKSFDSFSSWCNETIAAATANIKTGEETIESCNRRIEELSGFEAAGEAEIQNAEKNLLENGKRQTEASEIREKELKAFEASKAELDSSLKAMDEALAEFNSTEVTGSAFLQRRAGGLGSPGVLPIRKLLQLNLVSSKLAFQDLQLLSKFASAPPVGALLQGDINGEYNSASGQVIGVIKTTKDDFAEDLKELTEEEGEKKKVHGKMMSTLQKEQKDLKTFLVEQKTNAGNSVKELSDKKTLRDETTTQVKADQSLLTETEDTCKEKTYQFGERKKLRDQELKGVSSALEVLSSDDAKATFESAASFVQLTAQRTSPAEKAYQALQQTASQYHSLSLAKLAVQLKNGGSSFRKVLKQIDAQIDFLKKEEKEDVKHKERCLNQMEESDTAIATLEDSISKADTKIQRMQGRQAEMEDALKKLQDEIKETKKDIVERQENRDEERKEHLEALKHDQDGLELLETAMEQIGKFFKENKIDTGAALIQRHNAEPKYKEMPDAGFKDADYEGAKGSTKGLLGMMESIKGDMEAEIENGKKQDKENQALYEKDYGALQELLDTQKEQELTSTKALAELKSDTESKKELKDGKEDEKKAAEKNKENLNTDCAWVKTNFQSRREKRQAEIQGLVEAKGVLQAV